MGQHLAHSRSTDPQIADGRGVKPQAIRYTFAKRLAIATDIKAGISWREVAERHNVSQSTIHAAVHDSDIQEVLDDKIVESRRTSMASLYDLKSSAALETIDQDKLNNSSAAQLMIIAATATDKSRLLRGESTANLGIVQVLENISKEVEASQKTRHALESAILDAEIIEEQRSPSVESADKPAYIQPVLADISKSVDNQQNQN